jgi:hypothetical protein
MSVRPPDLSRLRSQDNAFDLVSHEILAEKASALGRAGRQAEVHLDRLAALDRDCQYRAGVLKDAADAVYAYFIQRELCGFRRHQDVIRDMRIPNEVLVRLGAK